MRIRCVSSVWTTALWIGCIAAASVAAQPVTTPQCLECHGAAGERPAGTGPDGMSIFVGDWEKSVHAGFECTDCHAGIASVPHDTPLPVPSCAACHSEETERYEHGSHGLRAAAGDSLAPRCASCHDPHSTRPSSEPESVLHPSRVAQVCIRCHADGRTVGSRVTSVPNPALSYAQGAHEQAMAAGNLEAATCGDCHEPHAVLRSTDMDSPIYVTHIAATCGKCHSQESAAYVASIHGQAVQRGAQGSPVCITCHGEHAVAAFGEGSRATVIASETCESCHNNPTLARRFGLPMDAVSSYQDSYHGRAARGGLAQAAGCTSCHGVHRILAKSDPASTINPANLVQTCSACHPGATPTFATSYAHNPASITSTDRATATVRRIYAWLIGLVIGGMLVHNLIVWRHQMARELAIHRARAVHMRFTRGEVRQHAVLLASFTLLVITGFALRYPDALWAQGLAWLGLDEGARRIVHRVAAVVMVGASLYHIFYWFTPRGRDQLRHLRPQARDLREALANVQYYLGRSARPPHFARFRYIEKAEYWALVWGTVVMVLTGFILWFPDRLNGPNWVVRVSEAVHLYEAWLAFLAIVVWHLFFVLVRPGVQGPLTMVTGGMDPEEMRHEHPEEYAAVYGGRPSRAKIQEGSAVTASEEAGPGGGRPGGGGA